MAVYSFKLLVGYYPNGVDNSQGYRAQLLKNSSEEVRFVYTEFPSLETFNYYISLGVEAEQIEFMQIEFTDQKDFRYRCPVDSILKILNSDGCQKVIENEKSINVIQENGICAEVVLCDDKNFASRVNYYCDNELLKYELYTDRLLCSVTNSAGISVWRFYNKDGSWSFDEYTGLGQRKFLFANGEVLNLSQMLDVYIQKKNFTEKDKIIIDRAGDMSFLSSLFKYKNGARLIGFIHSIHYGNVLEKMEERTWLYEYHNWIRNLEKFDTLVVSTEQQKRELIMQIAKICDGYIPNIAVIPAGGLKAIVKNETPRKRFSIVTASRLEDRKKINLIIEAVVKAHARFPEITLDIYGDGSGRNEYQNLIIERNADTYIKLKGFREDILNVLVNYEVFISASLWETLGLSMMEAVGAGNAVIALDVRYGSRLFAKNNINGKLVDFEFSDTVEKIIDNLADAIEQIFSDAGKMKLYEKNSYEIAEGYLAGSIRQKWNELLEIG